MGGDAALALAFEPHLAFAEPLHVAVELAHLGVAGRFGGTQRDAKRARRDACGGPVRSRLPCWAGCCQASASAVSSITMRAA